MISISCAGLSPAGLSESVTFVTYIIGKIIPIIYVTKVTDSDKPAGDRPANEIEVTPEMIEAGARVLWERFDMAITFGSQTGRDVAAEVFRAMNERRGKITPPQS